MFGLFKRRRQHKADALRNVRAPSTTQPPANTTPPDARPGEQGHRDWYTSSRDLHDGLVVSEDTDDVTLPAPLDDHEPPERH